MRSLNRVVLLAGILVLSRPKGGSFAAENPPFPVLGLGYEFNEGIPSARGMSRIPVPDPDSRADNPLAWRLEVLWADVEKEKGNYDWSPVDRLVERFRAAGHEPIVCFWGGNPLYSEEI